jgi:hypothetical protein
MGNKKPLKHLFSDQLYGMGVNRRSKKAKCLNTKKTAARAGSKKLKVGLCNFSSKPMNSILILILLLFMTPSETYSTPIHLLRGGKQHFQIGKNELYILIAPTFFSSCSNFKKRSL